MKAGDVIGEKYRLTRRIGKGANGIVWEAVDTLTEREVALKVLLQSADADQRERLLREAKACGRIKHPNVVEVLDVVEGESGADSAPFLVMPLLKGKTLAEALLGKPIPLEESVRYLRDVARGLVAAHEADVVHRDLKPQNVFLHEEEGSDEKRVVILDFGISRINTSPSSLTGADRTLGSPQYMSPEQLLGSKVDQRSDLWSFGVIAFQVFARRLPFTGGTILQTLTKVQSGEIPKLPPIVPAADAALSKIVSACLVRELDQRVQTAAECVKMLDSALVAAKRANPEPKKPSAQVASVAAPVGGGAAKAAVTAAPREDSGADWDVNPGPAKEAPKAAEAAPKPATEASKPATEPSKPATESPKPPADPPKPAADAPKPAIAAKPAVTVSVAQMGAGVRPLASRSLPSRKLSTPTAKAVEAPAPTVVNPRDSAIELDPDDDASDLEVAAPPKPPPAKSAPPKPPLKPARKEANGSAADQVVAEALADMGLGDSPKPALAAPSDSKAPEKEKDKPFEDLHVDLAAEPGTDAPVEGAKAEAKDAKDDAKDATEAKDDKTSSASPAEPVSEPKPAEADIAPPFRLAPPLADGEAPPSSLSALALTPTPGAPDDAAPPVVEDEPLKATETDDAPRTSAPVFAEDDIAPPAPRVSRKSLMVVGAAVVGAIVLAVIIASAAGGSNPEPQASASTPATNTTKAAATPPPTTPPAPTPTPTPTETQATPPETSAEPPASASASPSAAPSASGAKPRPNPNWKPPHAIAQPTSI